MNYNLRMHGRDQIMILILGTHFSLVRDAEKIELVIAWSKRVLHLVTGSGNTLSLPGHTMQESLVRGKARFRNGLRDWRSGQWSAI